jgi:hypothetical protein
MPCWLPTTQRSTILVDLALVTSLSREAARRLAAPSRDRYLRTTLLDPTAAVTRTIGTATAPADARAEITHSMARALMLRCSCS